MVLLISRAQSICLYLVYPQNTPPAVKYQQNEAEGRDNYSHNPHPSPVHENMWRIPKHWASHVYAPRPGSGKGAIFEPNRSMKIVDTGPLVCKG